MMYMLEHFLYIFCVHGTRTRGNSVRKISGKAAEYKLIWIGKEKSLVGERIF